MEDFSFLSRDKSPKRKKDLYIEVTVAPGRKGKIGVCINDNPTILASNFGKTFSLDPEAIYNLEIVLAQEILKLQGITPVTIKDLN